MNEDELRKELFKLLLMYQKDTKEFKETRDVIIEMLHNINEDIFFNSSSTLKRLIKII